MIVSALDIVSDAAGMVGDPARRRVTDALWLPLLRKVIRQVSARIPLLVQRATFDITTDDRYPYPDGLVGVEEIRYTPDPNDPDSYYNLREQNSDWLRDKTQRQYQQGDPLYYVPVPSWWHAFPKSPIGISDGGRIDYRTIPDLPTSVDAGTVELPMVAQDHIVEGLTIEGLRTLKMYDLADSREQRWRDYELELGTLLRGRSQDKRKQFAPALDVLQAQG